MRLTIIVAIYNAENYLEQCLESLLKQVSVNDEIILINDGSIDNSLEICKKYKKRFFECNIIIVNKKNEGISVTRNYGLNISNGDYILWIDADDWINENYIFEIKENILRTKADIILFDYYNINKNKKKIINYKSRSGYIDKITIMKDIAQDKFASTLWRVVIKKKIYDKIKFPDTKTMEDYAIYHELFYYADSCFYIHKPLYFYRVLETSLSHRKEQNIVKKYEIIEKRKNFFKENYPFFNEIYYNLPILINIGAFSQKKLISGECINNIRWLILKNIKFLLSREYLNLNKKIQMVIYMISPKLLIIIRNKILK